MKDLSYLPKHPNTGGWKDRHQDATAFARGALTVRSPNDGRRLEQAVAFAIQAWCEYAQAHQKRFESKIGEDCVLGPAWAAWGAALRTLLNGERGHLDCGTINTILHDNLTEQGFDPDQL